MTLCKLTAFFLCVILLAGCAKTNLDPNQIPVPSPDSVTVYELDIKKLQDTAAGEVLLLNSCTDKILYTVQINKRIDLRTYDPLSDTVEIIDTFEATKSHRGYRFWVTGCLLDGYAVYTVFDDNQYQAVYYLNLNTGQKKTVHFSEDLNEDDYRFCYIDASGIPVMRFGNLRYANNDNYYSISPNGEVLEVFDIQDLFDRSADKNFNVQQDHNSSVTDEAGNEYITVDVFNNDESLFESYTYTDETAFSMFITSYLLDDALVSVVRYRDADLIGSDGWKKCEQTGIYGRGKIVVEHFSGMHYEFDLDSFFPNQTWFPYDSIAANGRNFYSGANNNTVYFLSETLTSTVMLTVNEQDATIHGADLPIDGYITWVEQDNADVEEDAMLGSMTLLNVVPYPSGDNVSIGRGPGQAAIFVVEEPAMYDKGFIIYNETTGKLIVVQPPTNI